MLIERAFLFPPPTQSALIACGPHELRPRSPKALEEPRRRAGAAYTSHLPPTSFDRITSQPSCFLLLSFPTPFDFVRRLLHFFACGHLNPQKPCIFNLVKHITQAEDFFLQYLK
ncbi:hypothetical protein B0H16DRAFT_1883380 [Mycena metata]|uniref:Uncharacterized protein n=1 Tax=Mycena metata TaxID=1033252 RepID=A0AAD7JL08_9AGAR|nr:hypothetical protein B0H16DRAFT_1883380 [Mycena metata]